MICPCIVLSHVQPLRSSPPTFWPLDLLLHNKEIAQLQRYHHVCYLCLRHECVNSDWLLMNTVQALLNTFFPKRFSQVGILLYWRHGCRFVFVCAKAQLWPVKCWKCPVMTWISQSTQALSSTCLRPFPDLDIPFRSTLCQKVISHSTTSCNST